MEQLIGQDVQLWCMNYIYAGTLEDVTDLTVALVNARIVYETGPLLKPAKDAQALPGPRWCVNRSAIESYGIAPSK